jgi:iron complex transport system substrate-binding protein
MLDGNRRQSTAIDLFRPLAAALACASLLLFSCSPSPDENSSLQPSAPGLRIISPAPHRTETLFAIHAESLLAGRTDSCDFPADAASIPSTGLFGEPNIERILALRPTHVVYTDLLNKNIPDLLRQHNIIAQKIPCDNLDDIAPAIRGLGEITGLGGNAGALATNLETRLAELRDEAGRREKRPAVFMFMWHEPLMTVGRGSFISDLLVLAGGRNVADDIPDAYFNVSPEWAVARDPEIILSLLDASAGALHKNLSQHPGWSATRAVRENRVVENLPLDIICRPGPRVFEAVEAIRKALGEYD